MPAAPPRPDDLIPVPEAAALVARSPSSVRAWLRAGRLVKWREVPADEGSRALVSRAELLALAARELAPSPARPGPARPEEGELPAAAVEIARLRAELEGARLLLEATREHLAELRTGRAEALASERTRAEAEHARAEELAGELARTREELRAARAERDALRELAGLPWWRRLLPLPGPVSN